MNKNEQEYLNLLKNVLDNGVDRPDRTNTGIKGVFGRMTRYDLAESFPLLTTKKMNLKSIVSELLWFIEGSGDERRLAEIRYGKSRDKLNGKRTIWTDNATAPYWEDKALFQGDLNVVYGHQWRKWLTHDYTTIGLVDIRVPIEHKKIDGILTEEMLNRSYYHRAVQLWEHTKSVCSTKKVTMDDNWHDLANFINDISDIPYFYEWANDKSYRLDHMYYGAAHFSKTTCMFMKGAYTYSMPLINKKTGELFMDSHDASRKLNVPLHQLLDNLVNNVIYSNDTCEITKYKVPKGKVVRPLLVKDQLHDLINGLTHDPFGRRHIINAWNVAKLGNMALPPCHVMAQFYVDNNKLSCMLTQRSNDLFLGSPYNIASYALFTHMIAQVCGYDVGELVYSQGDVHIYADHVNAVTEQLSRKPKSPPQLWIDPTIKKIEDFTMDSFDIMGYDPYPSIEAKMAV